MLAVVGEALKSVLERAFSTTVRSLLALVIRGILGIYPQMIDPSASLLSEATGAPH
jgi:hypothetical protein